MTDSAYKGLTTGEAIFKSLVWDNLITAGLAAVFTEVPILAVWPLGALIRALTNFVTTKLYESLVLFLDIEAIKLVNSAHQAAYDKASIDLAVIAHDKGIESDEFKKARDAAKAALSQFTQFGGH